VREFQLYPPKRPRRPDVVRRVRFVAGGAELVAWSDEGRRISVARGHEVTTNLYAHDVAGGGCERLNLDEVNDCFGGPASDPVVSPDGRFLVAEAAVDGETDTFLHVQDRHDPETRFPLVDTARLVPGGLFFTPDGGALVAVRNWVAIDGEFQDVARFEMARLTEPPRRYKEQRNPLTGVTATVPVRNLRWKKLLGSPPWARVGVAALSADARFLAVGHADDVFHVADLKAKRVVASFPAEGTSLRDRLTVRLGFDPAATGLVRLAGGRLFARPLGPGKSWQTKRGLGYATDFAFHPSGDFLCAVFADGQARDLDPRTGAVLRAFRWARKALHSVAFAPDGLTCAAGGENGRVVVWDVE
jgi:WD40 repeat protein